MERKDKSKMRGIRLMKQWVISVDKSYPNTKWDLNGSILTGESMIAWLNSLLKWGWGEHQRDALNVLRDLYIKNRENPDMVFTKIYKSNSGGPDAFGNNMV